MQAASDGLCIGWEGKSKVQLGNIPHLVLIQQ